jgi:SOS-response transcriptional repressor LexA
MPTNDTTQRILDFIISYNDKRGEPPSMKDIAAHFGIVKGSVQYHINVLKEDNKIGWFEAKSGWKPL